MKNKHSLILATVLVLYLTSCSVQTNFIQPNRRNAQETDKINQTVFEAYGDDAFNNITPKISEEDRQVMKPQMQVKTSKRVLCSAFVPPEIPESPKVDLNKLMAIPGKDHEAVKNLLIDNIREMNAHAKQVEERLRDAYKKHRATCVNREIVTGREK